MMVRILAAVAMALCLATGAAQAQQQTATPPALTQPAVKAAMPTAASYGGASAGNLLQTIFGLCVVLGLLAVFAWAMKRYGPKASGGSAHLRLVGALNLGGRERILVVEVGDQWIVVGAAPGRVNALATMPKQATDASTLEIEPHQIPAASFGEWLKQTIDKRNAK